MRGVLREFIFLPEFRHGARLLHAAHRLRARSPWLRAREELGVAVPWKSRIREKERPRRSAVRAILSKAPENLPKKAGLPGGSFPRIRPARPAIGFPLSKSRRLAWRIVRLPTPQRLRPSPESRRLARRIVRLPTTSAAALRPRPACSVSTTPAARPKSRRLARRILRFPTPQQRPSPQKSRRLARRIIRFPTTSTALPPHRIPPARPADPSASHYISGSPPACPDRLYPPPACPADPSASHYPHPACPADRSASHYLSGSPWPAEWVAEWPAGSRSVGSRKRSATLAISIRKTAAAS